MGVILILGGFTVKEFLLGNWQMVLVAVLTVLALVLSGKKLSWWQWANEIAFFAWAKAEEKGLTDGWKGADKLRYYLEIYRIEYEKKWGTAPTNGSIERATIKAAELSAKEKTIRLPDPT
jgi:hypothetical protein